MLRYIAESPAIPEPRYQEKRLSGTALARYFISQKENLNNGTNRTQQRDGKLVLYWLCKMWCNNHKICNKLVYLAQLFGYAAR